MTDYHRKRQNKKTGEIILEKRAKLISALPIKSYTIMVNGHANQIAHVPELFQNNTQAKIDELMVNNRQLLVVISGGELTTNFALSLSLPLSVSLFLSHQTTMQEDYSPSLSSNPMQRKMITCSVCGKQFTSHANHRDHLNIHNDSRPFNCEVCGKQFKNSGSKSNHMRLHDPEKKFLCQICLKSFRWTSSLKAHLDSHIRNNGLAPDIAHAILKKEIARHRKRQPAKPICVQTAQSNSCVDNH
ncbi:Zinc finger protein [Trichinella sp. T8]|nr:Zinc finger protein [Trichinella sp. T8]